MTWAGARGETAAQMQRVLRLEGTPDQVLRTSGQLAAALQDPKRPITFRIANRLFGEKTYRFVPAYLEATRAAFGAPLEPLDFRGAPEPARARINAWVEEKTEKRIQGLIPPQGIRPRRRWCSSTRSTSSATGRRPSRNTRPGPGPSISRPRRRRRCPPCTSSARSGSPRAAG